jgi:hypothetical protein
VFELLASLVARSLVVAAEHGLETRYRLLETIRQYGEERLNETGELERWRARHADYYADLPRQIRHRHRRGEVFWAVRLSTQQDNLLAAWSWTIDTGNVDIAFSILAGFASSEIWHSYPPAAGRRSRGLRDRLGNDTPLITSTVVAALGEERAREQRGHGLGASSRLHPHPNRPSPRGIPI